MIPLRLEHPVHTLDGKILAEPGTVVAEETIDTLIRYGSNNAQSPRNLLAHQSVREDLIGMLGMPPYSSIFPHKVMVEELMHEMADIELAAPILVSMDYFKEWDFYTYRHILMVFALSTLLAKDLVPDYRERIRIDSTGPT
ncbi:MAG: hypothetical protein GWN61_11885, partial [candidate division Zixibacteria bacterium]|nr:hypothetical protein [candidate division Zixibacteria bacterium]NIR64910.1 hypothetical protein [candidate division Zixibacteria bacterium]NIS46716.1 hypothetical protein [candidate division Zixibacteria bacterium]NIU14845.1 hypothetical protein [candidate division Zixibacteria bacterium]NIV06845.1 hypothetical protein [candidate division Zixibacteria bacterium]